MIGLIGTLAMVIGTSLQAQDIAGDWQGLLYRGPQAYRIVLHVDKDAGGSWRADFRSLDEEFGQRPQPDSGLTLRDSVLKFAVPLVPGAYAGKLGADGVSIKGTWTTAHSGVRTLDFQRATKATLWTEARVDAAEQNRAIEGAIAKLKESYVFPDVAAQMADTLRAREKRGEYHAVTGGFAFANVLTQQLQGVSHDRHLRVNFSPFPIPSRPQNENPEAAAQYRRAMESINCGFVKVEQLAGNVGYLKFNLFADPEACAPTATAAMTFVANSDALIIDMRDNGGGAPKMVAFVCSYLFSQRTHLNDLWTRKTNSTEEFWTNPDVPGKRLGDDKPVYVLTSAHTFSGGEEFTYDLKMLKRATIIGETTGGGAHPVAGQRIDDHFVIGVPFARAINPISKTNWEGVGVEPDVKVAATDALTTAQKMAAERLSVRK